jgi:D-alanyl-D-alanine carboxypeptidase/D-alanyl-D-alanine-endopeptidase (penicillin-binding protein 4)
MPGFIILFLLLLIDNTACADGILQSRLADLLPRNARWGMVAVDLKTGKELARAGNASAEPLVPASLVKLFTSGAVLDHREWYGALDLRTTLLHDGECKDGTLHGNLYLVGKGNAFLSVAEVRGAVQKVTQNGIRKITGDVVADDTFFDTRGLKRSREGAGCAPAGALGLDLHTVAVSVSPTAPGNPPLVTIDPPNRTVRFAIGARTTTAATNGIKVVQLDDAAYRVSGNIAADSAPLQWRFSVNDPAIYAAGVVETCLRQAQIEVEAEVKKGKAPIDAKPLAEMDELSMRKLIRDMNVNSLNVVADNLLLALGSSKYGAPGTKEKGLQAMTEFLASSGLPAGEVKPADGSGLSGDNRATVYSTALYLAKITVKPWFGDFYSSLPRAGMEGTAANIGYRNEKFRIKTGILEDVFALAGFGVDGKGRAISFAYIVNVPGGGVMGLERSGAELMKLLTDLK